MRIGFAVAYVVHARDEALLDLHLRQIERHTDVPYPIYCSLNRLRPELRGKLERYERLEMEFLIVFGGVGCLAAGSDADGVRGA